MQALRLAALALPLLFAACAPKGVEETQKVMREDFFAQHPSPQTQATLEAAFAQGWHPNAIGTAAFLKTFLVEDPETLFELLTAHPEAIPNCEEILCAIIRDAYNDGNADLGLSALQIAESLYGNHPDVLATGGTVRLLADNPREGVPLLEAALAWKPQHQLASFYLGRFLLQSQDVGDRERGRTLLLSALKSKDPVFVTQAASLLLSPTVTPSVADVTDVFSALNTAGMLSAESLDRQSVALLTSLLERAIRANLPDTQRIIDALMRRDSLPTDAKLALLLTGLVTETTPQFASLLDNPDVKGIKSDDPQFLNKQFLEIGYLLRSNAPEQGIALLRSVLEAHPAATELLTRNFSMLSTPDLNISTRTELLQLLVACPIENPNLHLAAFKDLAKAQPLKEAQWVQAAIERVLPLVPEATAAWIFAQTAQTPLLVNALRTQLGPDMPRAALQMLVEGLFLTNEFPTLQAVLEREDLDFTEDSRAFHQARLAQAQGDSPAASAAWERANQSARQTGNFIILKRLGWLALEMQTPQNALSCLMDAFSAGVPFSQQEAKNLMGICVQFGTLAETLSVAQFLSDGFPDNPYHTNNLAYFNFLAKRNIDASVESMRAVVEDFGDIKEFQLTLALGLLRQGRSNEAARRIEDSRLEVTAMSTRGQLIYAAVLAASGENSIARGLAVNIDRSGLMPEEIAILEAI